MVHDGQHAVMLYDDKFQKCQFSCQETSDFLSITFTKLFSLHLFTMILDTGPHLGIV